jgi:hypothetical protein
VPVYRNLDTESRTIIRSTEILWSRYSSSRKARSRRPEPSTIKTRNCKGPYGWRLLRYWQTPGHPLPVPLLQFPGLGQWASCSTAHYAASEGVYVYFALLTSDWVHVHLKRKNNLSETSFVDGRSNNHLKETRISLLVTNN